MHRRTYLRTLGVVLGGASIAGCSSDGREGSATTPADATAATTTNDASAGSTRAERTATATPTETRSDDPTTARTESATARPTTSEPTTAIASEPTTTAGTVTGADLLVTTAALGEGWSHDGGSMPEVRSNGTITAVYRNTRPYSRRLRTRLWPCRGQTLDALGGTCSLGNLPDRQRATEGVETATFPLGETAFGWWSGPETDLEVVVDGYVFRMTHTPTEPGAASVPPREARLSELRRLARRQTTKLAGLPRIE